MSGSWKKYTFFDKDTVCENIEKTLGAKPTCAVAEGGMLLFGDESGTITLADRSFHISEKKEKAFRGSVFALSYIFDPSNQRRQFIVAIGDDSRLDAEYTSSSSNGINYIVKVFNLLDMSRPIQSFQACQNLTHGTILTSFAVLLDGTQIAAGFSTGLIVLISGLFLKEAGITRSQAHQVLLPRHSSPVSSLYYCQLPSKQANEHRIRLYAVFDSNASTAAAGSMLQSQGQSQSYNSMASHSLAAASASGGVDGLSGGGEGIDQAGILVFDTSMMTTSAGAIVPVNRRPAHVLDERGASPLCSSYMKETRELVLGRAEGVFSYSVEDRGGAAGFEGDKQCVSAVGRYVLIVCLDDKTRRNNVTIYDLRNKFISFTGQIAAGEKVVMVLHDGGMAYVVTSTHMLLRFRERDTSQKIEVLLRKSLFPVAIALATEEQSDVSEIMKLYKLYGDHSYKKADFDLSIAQYIATIGYVQPSYVIRISNLMLYLEKLQQKGLATKDHNTLLLTCYTKIKDEKRLSDFIVSSKPPSRLPAASNSSSSAAEEPWECNIDVNTSIDILHNSGFVGHALKLAAHFQHHEAYMKIQMGRGDVGYSEALSYIASLVCSPPSVPSISQLLVDLIVQHGKTLLTHKPAATTGLLIKLCTGDCHFESLALAPLSHVVPAVTTAPAPPSSSSSSKKSSDMLLPVETVIPIFIDDERHLRVLIEGVYFDPERQSKVVVPPQVTGLLLELYLMDYNTLSEDLAAAKLACKSGSSSSSSSSSLSLPRATTAPPPDLQQLAANIKTCEDKIMGLLDGYHTEYDPALALMLSHAFKFEQGDRFLLEKMQSIELLLRMYIEAKDGKGILKVLRREGRKDPELYVQVLTYFVQQAGAPSALSADEDDERWDAVIEVMSLIEKEAVLSPSQVIAILSSSKDLPLLVASRYIMKTLQDAKEDVNHLEQSFNSMRAKIDDIVQEETAKKQLGPRVSKGVLKAQAKAARRAQLIKNNSHYDEDEDEEDDYDDELEEQEKATEQKKWESIRKTQEDRANDHETFYAELENSVDGFATVAEYFGKAIIS